MRVQNQTTKAIALQDLLKDSQSQYQSGVKLLNLAPNGLANDAANIPDSIAGESPALQALFGTGELKIVGVTEELSELAVPGTFGGRVLFAGTVTLDGGGLFQIAFGTDGGADLDEVATSHTLALVTDYVVTVTQEGGAPTIIPRVSTKLVTGFTITGDAAAVVSVLAFRAV